MKTRKNILFILIVLLSFFIILRVYLITNKHEVKSLQIEMPKYEAPYLQANGYIGYYLIENNYIKYIEPETTVKSFKQKTEIEENVVVKDNGNNNILEDTDLIKTGSKVNVTSNNSTTTYTAVVIGDVNNDGKSDIKDIMRINKHRLNKVPLTDENLEASDVTDDSNTEIKDILKYNKYRLKRINTLLPKISPIDIKLNNNYAEMRVNNTYKFEATIWPKSATNQNISWTSENPSIATVDNNGNVIGRSVGETTITARTEDGGLVDTATVKICVPVEEIQIDEDNITIDISNSAYYKINATVLPETATNKNLIWMSSNEDIATVGKDGIITAKKNGTVQITVKTENDKTATCNVTVQTSPTGVALNKTNLTFDMSSTNLTAQLNTTVQPNTANVNTGIIWTSSDQAVATVSNSGLVTAKKNGTAQIKATTENNKTVICNVTVQTSPSGITLNKTNLTFDLSSNNITSQLSYTIQPSNSDETVLWTSSNEEVATVSDSGLVTAKKNGTAQITVKTSNNKTAICNVTVQTSPTGINLNQTSLNLDISNLNSYQLNATAVPNTANIQNNITWISSDATTAYVTSTGNVVAQKNGTVTITAYTENNKTASCSVTIQTSPTGVTLNKTSLTFDMSTSNLTAQLNANITPNTANINTGISWSSSDSTIATVSQTGLVTAKKVGNATITAKTANNKTATCSVTVQASSSGIVLDKTDITFDLSTTNLTSQINYTIQPANDNETVTWTSSDQAVATVSNSGLVTAKKNGITQITAKTSNNKTATCNVTVQTSPISISLNETNVTIDSSGTNNLQLSATIEPSTANVQNNITWISSDATIAYVTNTGNIIAQKSGTVTITAYTENGKSATCNVTVQTSPTSISLNKTSLTFDLSTSNLTSQLSATIQPNTANVNTGITWTSSNEEVATVNQTGIVTAHKNGTAIITAKTTNNKVATCSITVQTSSTGIILDKTDITFDLSTTNLTSQINYTIQPANNNETVTWTSSDQAIATVSNTGLVTAKKNGTATITAKTGNNKTAICSVTVQTSPTGINLNKTSETINLSETSTSQLSATIQPSTANVQNNITWISSDATIAYVTNAGNIIAQKNGTVTITAYTDNNKTASCSVTVQTSPTSISLNKTNETLDLSGTSTLQLSVSTLPSTANVNTGITWTSSNSQVVTVSNSGLVTAKKNGTATITAKTENNKTATCSITVQTSPSSVSLNQTSLTFDMSTTNLTSQLSTTIQPSTANVNTAIIWTSSNTQVATVSNTGLVTAKKNGTATITAKTGNNKTATCSVSIQTSSTGITLGKTSLTFDLSTTNLTSQLNYTIQPANNNETVTWISSDSTIATVSNSGLVTAKKNGIAQITATTSNNKTATCSVTVQTNPTGISLNKTNVTLDISGTNTTQLSTTVLPTTANINTAITWTSSDSTIASVSNSGLVTAQKNGTATITAKTGNNKTATCSITVQTNPTSVSLNQTSLTFDLSTTTTTAQLSTTVLPTTSNVNTAVTWTSSDSTIATVSNSGLVTAKKNGTATITAKTANNKTATCNITVQTNPTSVSLNQTSLTFDMSSTNLTAQLSATVQPSTANVNTGITWSSSNTTVATVSSSGLVTAKKEGTATITAKTGNNKTATCNVTVQTNITGISLNQTSLTFDLSTSTTTSQLSYTLQPTNSSTTVTWTSSDSTVASVSSTGLVTAKKNGTATITVKTANNKTASCSVTVQTNPTGVSLNKTSLTFDLATTTTTSQLSTTISPTTANINTGITWTSSDSTVATVSSSGLVTAKKNGTTTITAKTGNNKTATCSVTVQTNPTGVSLNKTSLTFDLATTTTTSQLSTTISPTTANVNTGITWTSSNSTVATVSSSGLVTAKKNGTATITAKTGNNKTATCSVTVTTTEETITISQTSLTLDLSSTTTTAQLSYTIQPTNNNATVTWTSSDTTVATVSNTGLVTAKKNGTATITVKTNNNKTAACNVTVQTSLTGISFDEMITYVDLSTSNQCQVMPTFEPSTANVGTSLSWTSSNTQVATISNTGVVTAKKNGMSVITVTTSNNLTAQYGLWVKTGPTSVSLDKSNIVLDISGTNTEQLTATISPDTANDYTDITWISSDATIASVTSSGLVTGQKNGTATITAYTENNKTASCSVTVQTSARTIYFTANHSSTTGYETIQKGTTKTITPVIEPSTANVNNTVTYSLSGYNKIATINSSTGLITAKQAGVMVLKAKLPNGNEASVNLNVKIGNTAMSKSALTSTSNDQSYSSAIMPYKSGDARMVIQNFDIDSGGNIFYAGTCKEDSNTDLGSYKSHFYKATGANKRPTDSGMLFVYSGHEHTIDVEEDGNNRYVWHPSFAKTLSGADSNGKGGNFAGSYAVSRIKYTAGTTVNFGPGTVTEKNSSKETIKTYSNISADNFVYRYKASTSIVSGLQAAVDEENRLLAIYFGGTTDNGETKTLNFRIYDLDEALALSNEKFENIQINIYNNPSSSVALKTEYLDFYAKNLGYTGGTGDNASLSIRPLLTLTVTDKQISNILTNDMQGFDIDGDYLYVIEGNKNAPTTVSAFDYMYEKNGHTPLFARTVVAASHTASFYNKMIVDGSTTNLLYTVNGKSFFETEGIKVKDGALYCGYLSNKVNSGSTNDLLASILKIK